MRALGASVLVLALGCATSLPAPGGEFTCAVDGDCVEPLVCAVDRVCRVERGQLDAGCVPFADVFAGEALEPQWVVGAGEALTLTVGGGAVVVDDAPFSLTPSNPNESWVNNLEVDRGNQLAWAEPIGRRDLELSFDFTWASSLPELTFAGLALTAARTRPTPSW